MENLNISKAERLKWLEICIDVDPIVHDSLSAFLFDLGCTGIASEESQDHVLKAYLPFQKNPEDITTLLNSFLRGLKNIFPALKPPKLAIFQIENQDWNRKWRQFFHADRVTSNLMILPAWEPVPFSLDHHLIRIDPGPAFGTGQHPTTRMCLKAMEKVHLPESWTMLDAGTGSGILAIYAAKLGAKRIVAIDIDPEALRWAEHNIELNALSGRIELFASFIEHLKGPFTILTANLILGDILKLLSRFSCLLGPAGWLILSGILREQVGEVTEILPAYGLQSPKTMVQKEWACIMSRKGHAS